MLSRCASKFLKLNRFLYPPWKKTNKCSIFIKDYKWKIIFHFPHHLFYWMVKKHQFLYIPTQIRFSDWGRTCHVSWGKLVNSISLGKHQLELSTGIWSSWTPLDRGICVVPAGAKQMLCFSYFFSIFESHERYTKTLNDWLQE